MTGAKAVKGIYQSPYSTPVALTQFISSAGGYSSPDISIYRRGRETWNLRAVTRSLFLFQSFGNELPQTCDSAASGLGA